MLELKVDNVPEGLEEHYKPNEDGSGFVLDVSGVVPKEQFESIVTEKEQVSSKVNELKSKVDEFRQNNITLKQQIEAAQGGDVPKVDALINNAVSEMKARLDSIESEKTNLQSQLEEVVLSDRVKDVAITNGVQESALPDVVTRAKAVFTVKDGRPIPKDSNSRDEEGNVLTPEKWLKSLEDKAPHLFKPSQGSGAHRPNGSNNLGGIKRSATDKIRDGLSRSKNNNKNIM